MSEDQKPSGARLAIETSEVDGTVRGEAAESPGREVGEVSDEEIDRILRSDEVAEGHSTRELDLRAFRGAEGGDG